MRSATPTRTTIATCIISTHGDYDENGNAVLLLSDGRVENRLTAPQLEALFEGIQGTKIILLDACYSGAFIGKGMPRAAGGRQLPFAGFQGAHQLRRHGGKLVLERIGRLRAGHVLLSRRF